MYFQYILKTSAICYVLNVLKTAFTDICVVAPEKYGDVNKYLEKKEKKR